MNEYRFTRVVADAFGEVLEIIQTTSAREAIAGARRDVRHWWHFEGSHVYVFVYDCRQNLDDDRPFFVVQPYGKLRRIRECEDCGEPMRRTTVGPTCRKCIIAGWVRGAIPAEDVEAFDVARECVA